MTYNTRPKSLQKREPYHPQDDSTKKVYVHPYKDIPHSYLLALLQAKGQVQHGLQATAYAKLCGNHYKKNKSKTSEAAEFEFQSNLSMKDPKPMPPHRSKAKQKVGRTTQKRVKISPVDVSQNDPRSFKKATARRRAAQKPTRLRLLKKTKVASPKPKASIAAKRIGMFFLQQTYLL